MYAMDTAVHFEHRNDSRRSRAELRRARRAATTPAAPQASTQASMQVDSPSATTESPVHEFLD